MRNMCVNYVARSVASTFSRGKRRESAMTAPSGFKGTCAICKTPGHRKAQRSKFLCESGGGSSTSSGAARITWYIYITRTFTTRSTAAPSSNSVSISGLAAIPVATTTAATATDAAKATALTRAEPTLQSHPTVRLRLQSSPLPRLLRLLRLLSKLILRLQLQRVASTRHRLPVTRRLRSSGPAEVYYDFGLQGIVIFYRQPPHRRHRVADGSDCKASSYFIDSHLIGDIESRMDRTARHRRISSTATSSATPSRGWIGLQDTAVFYRQPPHWRHRVADGGHREARPIGDDRRRRPQHAQRSQHGYPYHSRHRRPRLPPRHVTGHECAEAWPSPIFRWDGGP